MFSDYCPHHNLSWVFSCHVILCMSCHVMSWTSHLCHVMSCDVGWCHINSMFLCAHQRLPCLRKLTITNIWEKESRKSHNWMYGFVWWLVDLIRCVFGPASCLDWKYWSYEVKQNKQPVVTRNQTKDNEGVVNFQWSQPSGQSAGSSSQSSCVFILSTSGCWLYFST